MPAEPKRHHVRVERGHEDHALGRTLHLHDTEQAKIGVRVDTAHRYGRLLLDDGDFFADLAPFVDLLILAKPQLHLERLC